MLFKLYCVILLLVNCVLSAPITEKEAASVFTEVTSNVFRAYGSGDPSEAAKFFVDDAVYTVTLDGETEDNFGNDEVARFFRRESARGVLNYYFTYKGASIEGETIKASGVVKVLTAAGSESGTIQVTLVQKNGSWLIKEVVDTRKPDVAMH